MFESVEYRVLQLSDCTPELLKEFKRYQEVKRCWRKENGKWVLKDISFTEQWNDSKKADKIASFIWCIEHDGYVYGAFENKHLIGFGTLDSEFFGHNKEYIQLGMLHVSYEYRNKGIGKRLFNALTEKARQMDAKKLYISAHSSEESQVFYKAVGCIEAIEINQVLADKEPYDCQLEFIL